MKFGSSVRRRMLEGAFLSAADYLTAQRARAVLNEQIRANFAQVDVFAVPGARGRRKPSKTWTPTSKICGRVLPIRLILRDCRRSPALRFHRRESAGRIANRRAGFRRSDRFRLPTLTSKRRSGTNVARTYRSWTKFFDLEFLTVLTCLGRTRENTSQPKPAPSSAPPPVRSASTDPAVCARLLRFSTLHFIDLGQSPAFDDGLTVDDHVSTLLPFSQKTI